MPTELEQCVGLTGGGPAGDFSRLKSPCRSARRSRSRQSPYAQFVARARVNCARMRLEFNEDVQREGCTASALDAAGRCNAARLNLELRLREHLATEGAQAP